MVIYLELTAEFNQSRLRAVICSGQAAVLHRLAIASKDGAWILREDEEALDHVLAVLGRHGACYRFGAPLDVRWMRGGWSSHLEFQSAALRVRTDFFTRPPRVSSEELSQMWLDAEGQDPPFTGARVLAEMKKTDRQRDYPFIGELARLMSDPRDQLLYSRSADDLIRLAEGHADLLRELVPLRRVLSRIRDGRRALAEALQLEMLDSMDANAARIELFRTASASWARAWPKLSHEIDALPLSQAHSRIVTLADMVLPKEPRP